MNRLTHLLIISLFLFVSCDTESEVESVRYTDSDPPRNSQSVTIKQGVWGDVWFWSGNFMPPGRGEICQVIRKVLVYELTTKEEVDKVGYTPFYTAIHTKLIASVNSDVTGFFELKLEPGTYSLFVEEDDNYYSNLYNSQGIFPVVIEA